MVIKMDYSETEEINLTFENIEVNKELPDEDTDFYLGKTETINLENIEEIENELL